MKNSSCVSGRLRSSQHVKEREEGRDLRDGLEVERVFRSPVAEIPTWQAPFRRSSSVLPVKSCTTRFLGFPTGRRHDHGGSCR